MIPDTDKAYIAGLFDSEGEFYETSDNLVGDSNSDHNHDIKLH